ncbi:hypothetical protein TcCL_NonESM00238 [Trypanosoma cruzi]|nr:hypothetical protein TcCL_NonESM00238 [Trypanosoma cruzi]
MVEEDYDLRSVFGTFFFPMFNLYFVVDAFIRFMAFHCGAPFVALAVTPSFCSFFFCFVCLWRGFCFSFFPVKQQRWASLLPPLRLQWDPFCLLAVSSVLLWGKSFVKDN